MIQTQIVGKQPGKKTVTILNPTMNSGRVLLATYNRIGKAAIYYGCELNTLMYRIALINMTLYKVPAFLLRADKAKHDLSLNSTNWSLSNVWTPTPLNSLERIKDKTASVVGN